LNDLEKSNSRTRNDYKKLRTADLKSSTEHNSLAAEKTPRTDNLSQVLTQALQNSDKQMLETVLRNKEDEIVTNTLNSLPLDLIDPLLRELQKCLYYKGEQIVTYMKWLEKLIQTRLSFILTLPSMESELAPLLEVLNARTDVLDRMLRLKGRLSLMMSRVSHKEEKLLKHEPLLKYEESSSSDEDESSDDDAPIVESDEMEVDSDDSNNPDESGNDGESSDEEVVMNGGDESESS